MVLIVLRSSWYTNVATIESLDQRVSSTKHVAAPNYSYGNRRPANQIGRGTVAMSLPGEHVVFSKIGWPDWQSNPDDTDIRRGDVIGRYRPLGNLHRRDVLSDRVDHR